MGITMVLTDSYNRPLLNLRVAITQKCNLNCLYCHAEGEDNSDSQTTEITSREIGRIVRVAASLGISRVKLTGGEPLIRKDVVDVVHEISSNAHLTDLSITTNGTLLNHLAEELRHNGLHRVNVSLPTLDHDTYQVLTGGRVQDVLSGIQSAKEAHLYPVKINMLVLKGVNDLKVQEMIDFAGKTNTILQLIELEPINMSKEFYQTYHKSLDAYERHLKECATQVDERPYMQNRRVYHLPDTMVEVVHPIEDSEFCSHCTRLRVTSDGKLRPCLMRNDNLVDILTPLRKGASDQELANLFIAVNSIRHPYNGSQGAKESVAA